MKAILIPPMKIWIDSEYVAGKRELEQGLDLNVEWALTFNDRDGGIASFREEFLPPRIGWAIPDHRMGRKKRPCKALMGK